MLANDRVRRFQMIAFYKTISLTTRSVRLSLFMCLRMEFSANGGVRHFELFTIILKSRSLAIRASRPAMFVNPASLLAFLPMPANAGV